MIKKICLIILFIGVSSCDYKPVYQQKADLNLLIKEVQLEGNKNINRKVIKFLKLKDPKNKSSGYILKLNSTKKFVTGIYPYSLMTSSFSPISKKKQALKISFSAQEWCGNTFIQLNNRTNFEIDFHSYFESDADRKHSLKKKVLEDELWNQLRISPENIPTGNIEVIPSFEFLALHHKEIKSYAAVATLKTVDNLYFYKLNYPKLKRTLTIKISKEFPYYIQSWEETITKRGKTLTSKAEKISTILSAYWTKSGVGDTTERKALGL